MESDAVGKTNRPLVIGVDSLALGSYHLRASAYMVIGYLGACVDLCVRPSGRQLTIHIRVAVCLSTKLRIGRQARQKVTICK